MGRQKHPKPKEFPLSKASQPFGLLKTQGGFSLVEVLVVSIVLVILITTIYMGAEYAEKQVRHNYRHRIASYIASGEIEKQFTLYMKMGVFSPYSGRTCLIDETEEGKLEGTVSVRTGRDVEYYVTKQYPFYYLVAEVKWLDPENKKQHIVRMREDFYDVEGK